jgi:hypothetical protein
MHPRGTDIANHHQSSLSDQLTSYIHKTPYDIKITALELQVAHAVSFPRSEIWWLCLSMRPGGTDIAIHCQSSISDQLISYIHH